MVNEKLSDQASRRSRKVDWSCVEGRRADRRLWTSDWSWCGGGSTSLWKTLVWRNPRRQPRSLRRRRGCRCSRRPPRQSSTAVAARRRSTGGWWRSSAGVVVASSPGTDRRAPAAHGPPPAETATSAVRLGECRRSRTAWAAWRGCAAVARRPGAGRDHPVATSAPRTGPPAVGDKAVEDGRADADAAVAADAAGTDTSPNRCTDEAWRKTLPPEHLHLHNTRPIRCRIL